MSQPTTIQIQVAVDEDGNYVMDNKSITRLNLTINLPQATELTDSGGEYLLS